MSFEKEWMKETDDLQFQYRPPAEEITFFDAVKDGNINLVQENCMNKRFGDQTGMGTLSQNPVMNMKYHFVVTAALVSRFCIEAGMPISQAFSLSDYYIQKADLCRTVPEVIQKHTQMVMDYTRRMRMIRHPSASKQVTDAIDYIYNHITERITVEELSKAVCISPTYFSRVFKKEVGVSISGYIRARKIDYAKNLLQFSDMDMADIAAYLSFSSQSHFIQQFRQQTGITPKVFRDNNHNTSWWTPTKTTPDGAESTEQES